jgi:hypothetical protein
MSYILKALKRAENDRSKDNPKNFEDILSDEWSTREPNTKNYSGWTFFLAVLLIIAAVLILSIVLTDTTLNQRNSSFDESSKKIDSGMIAEIQEIVISDSAANGLSLNNNPIQSSISIDNIGKDISGYIFAGPNSSANRIFIGGKSYKKGFTMEDGWLITAIMQDGFLIEKDGKKKKLSYP